jgi:rhodanese-related sulfurtransferase
MAVKKVTRLVAEELRSRRSQGETILTLDVRSPDARVVHPYEIPGSRWLPLSEVVEQAAALPRGDAIVVYCT